MSLREASAADAPSPAVVHLPRSLVALFPGAERRIEARGSTVHELIMDLDRTLPGAANRVLDAGPTIRTHLNIFVDGERAALDTPVRPAARVHIIPGVSGG
jgi:molybdopterin synthase sulfur carrier subunit